MHQHQPPSLLGTDLDGVRKAVQRGSKCSATSKIQFPLDNTIQCSDTTPLSLLSNTTFTMDKGDTRAYFLGILVCLGGFMFGYDTGVVGKFLSCALAFTTLP